MNYPEDYNFTKKTENVFLILSHHYVVMT